MLNVKYTGTFGDYSGYGDANRMDISSLFTAGINLTTESIRQVAEKNNYGIPENIALGLADRDIPYKIKILHITPDMYPRYKENGIYNIGRLAWETNRLPNVWVAACNDMQEIWTMSEQMADMIRRSGVKRQISVFPEPIFTPKGEENIKSFETQYKKDFFFYSIFQWIPRKNPRALLRAYWKSFEGNDNITLLLKTYRVNYSEGEFNLLKDELENYRKELKLKHYPKIYLIKKLLNNNEMWKLHKTGDCYVNGSSGEGWNRPLQEAMLLGKPTISGNNGGITDWMPNNYYYSVKSNLAPVTVVNHIAWYQPPQEWKEIDEGDLGAKMMEVYKNYEYAKEIGLKAKEYVMENFSWQKVGMEMKKRLEEIYNKL